MIILGMVLFFTGIVLTLYYVRNKERTSNILLLLGLILITSDLFIPAQIVEEEIIQTTDYAMYNLPIETSRAGLVLKRVSRSVFPLAITGNKIEYIFLDWVSE